MGHTDNGLTITKVYLIKLTEFFLFFRSIIEALDTKLQQWNEYETLKDQCMTWIRETDTKLHAVDLKATSQEKKDQLEMLKVILTLFY
jgi:hypothetical protein